MRCGSQVTVQLRSLALTVKCGISQRRLVKQQLNWLLSSPISASGGWIENWPREENEEGDDDERSEELNAEFGDTDNRSLLFADDAIEGQLIEGAESSFFRCFVQILLDATRNENASNENKAFSKSISQPLEEAIISDILAAIEFGGTVGSDHDSSRGDKQVIHNNGKTPLLADWAVLGPLVHELTTLLPIEELKVSNENISSESSAKGGVNHAVVASAENVEGDDKMDVDEGDGCDAAAESMPACDSIFFQCCNSSVLQWAWSCRRFQQQWRKRSWFKYFITTVVP